MNQKKHKTKIGHSLEQLQDGLILTIQDKPVLLNGEINEDDDVFENYQKRVQNQAQHNRQLKQKLKVIANAATSHLQAKNQGAKGLLPHYDDHKYKSDQIDLDSGNFGKRSRPKVPKNIVNDFETPQNINTQYYQRGNTKFKQRKKQKTNTAELLNFLNQTAVQKYITDQNINNQAADLIQQSLNTVRKRRRVQNQSIQTSNIANTEDEQLLAKAIKIGRQKNQQQQMKVLDMIKQQEQDGNTELKHTEIQMKPVNYKITNASDQAKKVYNISDAAKGTTSCLFVNLPSEKIVVKKQQEVYDTFKDVTPEQLQKMKQEISFLQQKDMGLGLAGTLEFLRENNMLGQEQQFGRTNDKESHHNKPGDRVKIQYRNASGKLMKPKQAFRYLSAKFHGQGPSKNKIQKIKKKQLLQMRIKQAANGPSKMMNLLQQHQSKTGQAHMFIQLGSKNKQQQ